MKKIVRPLDLKSKDGVLILDWEDNPSNVKEGVYYINKKTQALSDENFLKWLEEKTNITKSELKKDLFTKEFAFLQKLESKLIFGIALVVDYLFEANGLKKEKIEHIIPDPY